MRVDTVRELALATAARLPRVSSRWLSFEGLLDFIDQYAALCDLLTHLEDFARLGSEVVGDLAANGVTYAEALFAVGARERSTTTGPRPRGSTLAAGDARTAPSFASPPTSCATMGWRPRAHVGRPEFADRASPD